MARVVILALLILLGGALARELQQADAIAPSPTDEAGELLEVASIFSSNKPDVTYNAVQVPYYELIAGKFAQRATDLSSLEGLTLAVWWKTLKYKLTLPKLDYDPFEGVMTLNSTYQANPVYYLSGVEIDKNVFSTNTFVHFRAKLFTNNSRVFLNYAQYEGKSNVKTYSEALFEKVANHVFYSQIQLG